MYNITLYGYITFFLYLFINDGHLSCFSIFTSLVAQMVKASAYNAGDPDSILGREDPLEKEMATHPFPVLLLGKSHRWRSLVGYSPWGRKESYATE